MRYGHIAGISKRVSRLVQGTVMVNEANPENFKLLDDIFELGCTTFDTAHVYGSGTNERAVGAWVRERGLRDRLVIIGKGAHHNEDRKRVTPYDIKSDLHDSLTRLDFEKIDLYLLHRDDESVPVDELVDVLNDLKNAGLIDAFGGSNWSHTRIEAANRYAAQNALTPFAVSSPNFSLAEQIEEPWPGCISISGREGEEARGYYRDKSTPLFTWSSLAGGFFSGRYTRDNLDSFQDYFGRLCVTSYGYEGNFQRLDRVKELAKQLNLSIPQVALAYVLNTDLDIYALIGASTPAEFKANLVALETQLSAEQLRWLEEG